MKKNNYYWIVLWIILIGILIYWLGGSKNNDEVQDNKLQNVEVLKDMNFSWEALDLKKVDNANLSGDEGELMLSWGFTP